tara:strand:- start:813 stop:1034 length:222 start_codon:yes stop_codon:yes gene_type:complete
MLFSFKKLFFNITFNFSLFLLLIIGIQNSANKTKINLIIDESVNLPISFIVGISFISGSLVGSILSANFNKEK